MVAWFVVVVPHAAKRNAIIPITFFIHVQLSFLVVYALLSSLPAMWEPHFCIKTYRKFPANASLFHTKILILRVASHFHGWLNRGSAYCVVHPNRVDAGVNPA